MFFYILQTFKIMLSSLLRFTRYVNIITLEGATKITKCKAEMFIGSQYWTALGNSEPLTYPGALGAVSLSGKLISFQSIQVRKADFPPAFFTGPGAARWFGECYQSNPGRRITPALNGDRAPS